jgi:hypothetical protein
MNPGGVIEMGALTAPPYTRSVFAAVVVTEGAVRKNELVPFTCPSEALIGVPVAPVIAMIPPAIACPEPESVNVYDAGSVAPAILYHA